MLFIRKHCELFLHQVLAGIPCLTDLFTADIVTVLELVKNQGIQLFGNDLALFVKDSFLSLCIDNSAHDRIHIFRVNDLRKLTFHYKREFLNDRCIDLFAFYGMITCTLKLVVNFVAGVNAEEISHIEVSREIRAYADEIGFEKRYSYRIALCIEEMAAYVKSSQKNGNINIQIIIRFQENGAIFMMLDDGKCIALDNLKETRELSISNYGLIKKLANTVEYQYLQNMNYSVLTFDCPMHHKQEERT